LPIGCIRNVRKTFESDARQPSHLFVATDRGEEGVLGGLDPTLIDRLELQETVGPHGGMVNMFIGERYVLQDRQKLRLPREALDEVTHGVQSHQGMQWTAVMAWREV
jgi:hypothetical protein